MKSWTQSFLAVIFFLFFTLSVSAEVLDQSPRSWPRELVGNNIEMTVYQPQLTEQRDSQLFFNIAFAVKPKNDATSAYGVANGHCALSFDDEQKNATCESFQFDAINFPLQKSSEDELKNILTNNFSDDKLAMPMQQLQSSLRMSDIKSQQSQLDLENKPPRIYVADRPTALISIDGKPTLHSLPDSTLMRVINTGYVIIFDPENNQYYLRGGKQWHRADSLEETTWEIVTDVPKALKGMEQQFKDESDEGAGITSFIVSTEPASLIVTDGQPQYEPIEGTDLLGVSNSSTMVFMQLKTQHIFALLSGRWYQADQFKTETKWEYIPADQLPKSFANIPPDSEYGSVLANIPATPQAQEAQIRNEVPTVAAIDKSKVSLKVNYDGQPRFEKIRKTPLRYAVNANNPVIWYEDRYYANRDAIWFISNSPYGPWIVTDYLPDVIYTIPPENPLYHLTFNYVYGGYNGLIYFGYTPGYLGSYISPYGTVIFGTGYHYHPWVGIHYYGFPSTWGGSYYYHPYYGWYNNSPYLWIGASLSLGWVGQNIWYNNWYPHHGYKSKNYWNLHKNVYNKWDNKFVKTWRPKYKHRIDDRIIKKPPRRDFVGPKTIRPDGKQRPPRLTRPEIRPETLEEKGPWVRPKEPKVTRPDIRPKSPKRQGPWVRPKEPKVTRPDIRPKTPRGQGPWVRPKEPKATRPDIRPKSPAVKRPSVRPQKPQVVPPRKIRPTKKLPPKTTVRPRSRSSEIKREPVRVIRPDVSRAPPRGVQQKIKTAPKVRRPSIKHRPTRATPLNVVPKREVPRRPVPRVQP